MGLKGSAGSGKLTVLSLLLIIGLSVIGVITALTGEKHTATVDNPVQAESQQPSVPQADQ